MAVEGVPGRVPESINCYQCGAVIDLTGQTAFSHVDCGQCGAISVVPLQFGNFLLLNSLGVGGMGTVYKAIDLSLNRYLALKILRRKLASKPEFIESFSREARAAAAVNHPNIAQVYSFGEHQGQYYLAMELLERGSLDDRMTTLGKIPEKDVLEIGMQVASGLRAAEQRGLLHRDIKPGNILFNDDGMPKIVDFGLARASNQAQASSEPIWGTPYYIAPEKLRGQPEDARSDIYSLGATLYHALAGRPPFDAATASEVVTKHATQPAFSLKTYAPDIQPSTAHVIGRMLSKNPAERYQTYEALIHELNEAIATYKNARAQRTVVAAGGERIPLSSVLATFITFVVAGIAVWFVWVNRVSIFHLENASTTNGPAVPPPSSTNGGSPTGVPPVARPPTVDFNADESWVKPWNDALLDLTQARFQDAFQNFDSAKRLAGTERVTVRQWIHFYEGLALLAADRSALGLAAFVRGVNRAAPRLVPETVTTGNFVDCLVFTMVNEMPPDALEQALPRLPGWAAALAEVTLAFKDLEKQRLAPASQRFRRYALREPSRPERWVYALQPLAQRLADQCDQALRAAADVTALLEQNQPEQAQARLTQAQSAITHSQIRPVLQPVTGKLNAALAQLEEQRTREREAAERQRAEREARERERAQAEMKLAETIEPQVAPLLQRYDFAGARQKYVEFENTMETALGRQAVRHRIAVVDLLSEFRQQLIADIARRPYPGANLRTRDNRRLTGDLRRATATELFFATQYGEFVHTWVEFAPSELLKMAASYATQFASVEDATTQAARYLRLAVFAQRYGYDDMARSLARETLKRDPALENLLRQGGVAVGE